MLGRTYDNLNCSVARSLEVVGERWTLLILRDAFFGVRRFDDFQRDLGVARNVLQTRLERLVEEDILRRVPYQDRPVRCEYRLTEKGLDLWPILVAMLAWGDKHAAPAEGPPLRLVHHGCGGGVNDRRVCDRCGAELTVHDVRGVRPETAAPVEVAAG